MTIRTYTILDSLEERLAAGRRRVVSDWRAMLLLQQALETVPESRRDGMLRPKYHGGANFTSATGGIWESRAIPLSPTFVPSHLSLRQAGPDRRE